MRKLLLPLLSLLTSCTKAQTTIQDTLILNDGKIVAGTMDDKSLYALFNIQANINSWHTNIMHADKPQEKIQNKDIQNVIIGGIKYTNKRVIGGNKLVQILVDGLYAQMYILAGNEYDRYSWGSPGEAGVRTRETPKLTYRWMEWTQISVEGKPLPYAVGRAPLSRVFNKLFDKCPKLLEESAKPGFNFEDYEGIVKKYNACF